MVTDDYTCVLRPGGSWMHETVCSVFLDLGSKLISPIVAEELSSFLPHSGLQHPGRRDRWELRA